MAVRRSAKLDRIVRKGDMEALVDFITETSKADLKSLSKSKHYPEWVRAALRRATKLELFSLRIVPHFGEGQLIFELNNKESRLTYLSGFVHVMRTRTHFIIHKYK